LSFISSKYICQITLIFNFALIFFCSENGYSQTFKSGIIGGFCMSQISGDDLGGYDKPGAIIGMFLNKKTSLKWEAELQMFYIQKGSRKYPDIKNGSNARYSLNLNYIEVPLIFRYKIKNIFLEFGISNSAMFKQYVGNESGEFPANSNQAAPFHKWELSYNLGAAYSLGKHFEICGRINHSILPVRIKSFIYRWIDKGQFNDLLVWVLKYKF